MSRTVALVLLAIANIIWGSSHAVGKIATDSFDPILLAGLRVVIATGIFWGIRISRIAPADHITNQQRAQLAALGIIAVAAAQMLDYSGLSLTTATDSSLMIIGEVIFTAVLAVLIAKEYLGWQRASGLAIGIVGVVVLTLGGAPNSEYAPNRLLGNTLVLAALFCEALFTVIGANIAQRYHPHRDALDIHGEFGHLGAHHHLSRRHGHIPIRGMGCLVGSRLCGRLYLGH